MWAYKLLRTKHFHGVSSGNQHPYLLKSRYGKVRDILRHVQAKYHLTKKHYNQLVQNLSILCVFPHRAVVDAVGADGTYGTHPVHESIVFRALQEYHLLPPGRPAYTRPRGPSLRDALANVLQSTNKKQRKAS